MKNVLKNVIIKLPEIPKFKRTSAALALTIAFGAPAGLATMQAAEVPAETSSLSIEGLTVASPEQSIASRDLSTSLGFTGALGSTWRSSPNTVWPSSNGSIGLSINLTNNRTQSSTFQWQIERRNANGAWAPVWTSGSISVGANNTVTLNPATRGVTGNANYRISVRAASGTFNINWGTVTFR